MPTGDMSASRSADSGTPPVESIRHLFDVFIELGYAEEEDLPHLDNIHAWLLSLPPNNGSETQ